MCLNNTYTDSKISKLERDPQSNLYNIIENEDTVNPLIDNCCYFEPVQISELNGKKYKIKALHLNIQSLPNKVDQLITLLGTLKDVGCEIDVVLLCETWLSDININNCFIPGYTLIEQHRASSRGGGVALYINDNISFMPRKDLNIFDEGVFESFFVEINLKNSRPIIIGDIYRIPNTDPDIFIENYDNILTKVELENKDIIIGTDQNLDFLKLDSYPKTEKFLQDNLDRGILPNITKPTRITHSTATLIDNIYTKFRHSPQVQACILLSQLSDHLPCLLLIDKRVEPKKKSVSFTTRKLDDNTLLSIKYEPMNKNWDILKALDVNRSYELLTDEIKYALDKYSPIITKTVSARNIIRCSWMTPGLLKSSHTCDKLYRNCIGKAKDHPDTLKFIEYRNNYNRIKRNAKFSYYRNKIVSFKKNSVKLWKTLNKIIGKLNNKSSLSDIFVIDGNEVSDPLKISNGFCNFFTNVGKQFASKIPKPNKEYHEYLDDTHPSSFYFHPCSEEDIYKIISKLKSKKSMGHD